MINFQQKKMWRHIFQSKLFLTFLGLIILFFSWNVWGLWNKMEETSRNKMVEEEKIATLKQQQEKLSSDINSLNTDQGKEKIFRENYGLAKEGEDMIVVEENTNLPPNTPVQNEGFFSSLMFWKNWFK